MKTEFFLSGKKDTQEQESEKKQKIKKQITSIKYIQENQIWFLKKTNKTMAKLLKKKRETDK